MAKERDRTRKRCSNCASTCVSLHPSTHPPFANNSQQRGLPLTLGAHLQFKDILHGIKFLFVSIPPARYIVSQLHLPGPMTQNKPAFASSRSSPSLLAGKGTPHLAVNSSKLSSPCSPDLLLTVVLNVCALPYPPAPTGAHDRRGTAEQIHVWERRRAAEGEWVRVARRRRVDVDMDGVWVV